MQDADIIEARCIGEKRRGLLLELHFDHAHLPTGRMPRQRDREGRPDQGDRHSRSQIRQSGVNSSPAAGATRNNVLLNRQAPPAPPSQSPPPTPPPPPHPHHPPP